MFLAELMLIVKKCNWKLSKISQTWRLVRSLSLAHVVEQLINRIMAGIYVYDPVSGTGFKVAFAE